MIRIYTFVVEDGEIVGEITAEVDGPGFPLGDTATQLLEYLRHKILSMVAACFYYGRWRIEEK